MKFEFWFRPYVTVDGYEYHVFFSDKIRFKVMRFSDHWTEMRVFDNIESATEYIRTIRRVKRVLT